MIPRIGPLWRRLRSTPRLGRDIAAVATLVVLGLIAATLILAQLNVSPPWRVRTKLGVEVADAIGVSPGNSQEVRIAGVPVGFITDARPTARGTTVLTLSIDSGTTIFTNASAVLRPKNPLNEMYLELSPGGPPAPPLAPGATLPVTQTSRPVQIEEALGHLDARARAALTALISESDIALARAPRVLPGALTATQRSLARLQPVVLALQQRRRNIQRLIGGLADVAAAVGHDDARLTALLDDTQHTLGVLARRDDQLARTLDQLPGLSGDLSGALRATSALAVQLNPTLDDLYAAAAALPPALRRLGDTAASVRDTARTGTPVLARLRPVLADLRPISASVRETLSQLRPVTRWADYVTAQLAPWMYDLSAFVVNTNSVFSIGEPGGRRLGRGAITFDPARPDGLTSATDARTGTYRDAPSPLGRYPAPGEGGPR
jgi:phospholipid/cholesterol/gamma-HCH transport system substrate-binding protein